MPRSKKQCKQMVDERRENILRSSLSVFAIKGYDGVRMDDISKAAHCSHGLVYHYFPTKKELFVELMPKVREHIQQLSIKVNYEAKAKESLLQYLTLLICEVKKDVHFAEALYLVLNLHLQGKDLPQPKVDPKTRPIEQKRPFEIIMLLIEKGQKEQDFIKGNVKELAIAIAAMLDGLAYNRIYMKDKFIAPNPNIIMNIVLRKGT